MNPALKADRVRAAYGQTTAPIDVEAVARAADIDLVTYALNDATSGLIVKGKDGRVTIGVNAGHHSNRRRFTIAHELGHFFLHNGGERMFVDMRDHRASLGTDRREIDANRFAASLLIPETLLREELEGVAVGVGDMGRIAALASMFQVSNQAMQLRLSSLDLLFDDSDDG